MFTKDNLVFVYNEKKELYFFTPVKVISNYPILFGKLFLLYYIGILGLYFNTSVV